MQQVADSATISQVLDDLYLFFVVGLSMRQYPHANNIAHRKFKNNVIRLHHDCSVRSQLFWREVANGASVDSDESRVIGQVPSETRQQRRFARSVWTNEDGDAAGLYRRGD